MPWTLLRGISNRLFAVLKRAFNKPRSSESPNKQKGASGEIEAYNFLRRSGYKIIARNYKQRLGEIDLIGWDGDVLAFVEVKYRASAQRGRPEESVTRFKQKQICRLARQYRARHNLHDINYRFDVVSIQERTGPVPLQLIKNAFNDQR
jgi:putative endonuclease